MSDDEKARRKESKLAAKDQAIADTAMAKLPADKAVRDEYFREAGALKTDAQSVAGLIGQHKKRGREVYGITKEAMQIRGILAKCHQGVYEATVKQLGIFLRDLDRPFQLSMFDAQPGQGSVDDESVFDRTVAGESHAAERGDDPGRARKRRGKDEPPAAPQDTGALGSEEALARFEAAKAANPPSGSDDDVDLRPRHLRQAEALPGAEGSGSYKLVH